MPRTNKVLNNIVGGILSPLMHSRSELPIFQKGMAQVINNIVLPQGGARFRNGTKYVKWTRLNQDAVFIPFQFSDRQSYLIEATAKKLRFYKDEGIILKPSFNITAITKANPGVFTTSAAHGLAVGDEVYIDGVAGMTNFNGKFFLVNSVPSGTTFSLETIPPAGGASTAIDTSSFAAYTSGGTVAAVYEIDSPYLEVDLRKIQHAQIADLMYLANVRYEPYKLSRGGHADWTLATYSRTANPFTNTSKAITAMTIANPAVFTAATHGLSPGDEIRIAGTGTAQLCDKYFIVRTVPTASTFTLYYEDGETVVDSTGWTHANGNTLIRTMLWPAAVTFIDSARLVFGGCRDKPETIFASQAPSAAGVSAYDNFTTGTTATSAIIFTLAPIHGKVDAIKWLTSTNKFIVAGTFGSIRRIYGTTEEEPISPTSVTAKSVNAYGCAETLPISNGSSLFYVQRGGKILRSLEYDYAVDGYTTTDRHLVADHLTTNTEMIQIIEQQGTPDIAWAVLDDGKLLGLTYKEKEDISGWHQHYLGGRHTNDNGITVGHARILSAGRMPRTVGGDQLWFVVERVINGNTYRSIEFMADQPRFPHLADYFTGTDNQESDLQKYENALYEIQKQAVHLDMASIYDGSDQAANLTPGAGATATGTTGVTFTASSGVFTSNMVGREIWKKYDINGDGGGRALITGYTNSTTITCEILTAFDSVSAISAGGWYLTTDTISGLDHLEGETVSVCADGGAHEDCVVANGSITLEQQASVAVVGLPYIGILETLNIDSGGILGPAQSKPRSIIKVVMRLLHTVGISFGSSIYRQQPITLRAGIGLDRPVPAFCGTVEPTYIDRYESQNKSVVILQEYPLPCTVLSMDVFMDTTDE